MYTVEEIKIANATSRTNGASARNKDGSIRAVVPRYIAEHYMPKSRTILDFGAGKGAQATLWLREFGFHCDAYDFGENVIKGLHKTDALKYKYDVVFASNVLNVQSSLNMLIETLHQIYNILESGGEFVANYPTSPRKMVLSSEDMCDLISNVFHGHAERVGGTKQAPIWRIVKPFTN